MRKMLNILVIFFFGFGVTICLVPRSYKDVAKHLGGVPAPIDESGNPCYWFNKDSQLICFREQSSWLVKDDAVPLYVIDKGKYIPLFQ